MSGRRAAARAARRGGIIGGVDGDDRDEPPAGPGSMLPRQRNALRGVLRSMDRADRERLAREYADRGELEIAAFVQRSVDGEGPWPGRRTDGDDAADRPAG